MKKKKLLSVKELVQLTAERRALAALYGTDFDKGATSFVKFWHHFAVHSSPENFADGLKRDGSGQLCDMFMSMLEPRITKAIKLGDGTFLRKLADAIERHAQPLDIVRHTIGIMALCQKEGRDVEGGWHHTAEVWRVEIERQTGKPIGITQFRRWAAEMGLKYLPDKRGRKPLPKLKLKKAN